MSLNILTADGLQEVGKVTKEKVVSALGYEPVNEEDLPNIQEDGSGELHISDENGNVIARVDSDGIHATEVEANGIMLGQAITEHTSNDSVHVTAAEKEVWNNKSEFSGVYDELINAPNITEDTSGNMIITDDDGYIIMQVDSDGVKTTNLNAKTIQLNGEDLGSRFDSLESSSLSNIVDDESGELVIADESKKIIVKIDANGLTTTSVTAGSAIINGTDVVVKLDEHEETIKGVADDMSAHTTNTSVHISADERNSWNSKSDFSGDYKDLDNAPNIYEDGSKSAFFADEEGHIILRVDGSGLETTNIIAQCVTVNGLDVESVLAEKANAIHIHDQYLEARDVEGFATEEYVSRAIAEAQLAEGEVDLSAYYTKAEIDALELITVADIDAICGATYNDTFELISVDDVDTICGTNIEVVDADINTF